MVYVLGLIGFIVGFGAGQMLLHFLLRHKTKEELLNDDSLKWKYGLVNWGMAALGAYAFVQTYKEYLTLSY